MSEKKTEQELGYFEGEFLAGYRDKEGGVHKAFTYRDMDGNDEEAISKDNVRSNPAKMVKTILTRCIMSIGEISKKDLTSEEWGLLIDSLYIGDQDIALLKIREESLGDEFEVRHTCSHCQHELDTVIGTDELKIIPFSGEHEVKIELPKGYRDKDGKVHKSVVARFPTGLDRTMIAEVAKKDQSKANTLLLTRCIKSLGTIEVITDEIMRSMSLKDRRAIISELQDKSFGIDTEVPITCPECGSEAKVSLQVLNFI